LPGFWIARYPLTVAQYRVFIEDGGYQQQDYWTPEGWEWIQNHNRTKPWDWDDVQYNRPNHAVSSLPWYECMAFCAWMTTLLANELPAGYAVQLPTEAQWEVAAAYDGQRQRRSYPWGEKETTPDLAIFADAPGSKRTESFKDKPGNQIGTFADDPGAPAVVGVCPAGAAACGALDLGGQVWEWCRSSYKAYPQGASEGLSEFNQNQWGVPMRGGSWDESSANVCCAVRISRIPRFLGVGFRIVLAPRDPTTTHEDT
jgi:formylglycine-generating enzyme required for sulfatase activity